MVLDEINDAITVNDYCKIPVRQNIKTIKLKAQPFG